MESAHRGRMPADQASSSSSAAPVQRDVARACERACGVPCNLRVARQRATQQNAAMEGAVGIAQQEAAEWEHGMAIHASTVAAIAAGLTAGAAHEAATAQVKGEVAAAAEEACLTQDRDAGSNSHEFARIRIRPEFARICAPIRTRIRNFKFQSSLIRLTESMGTYNLPSRLQFTCLHMGMPRPSTISHKRFPKSFRNLAIFVVCCCLHLPC